MIEAVFLARTKGEWIDALEAAGVPCALIQTMPEALASEQARAIGIVQAVPGDDYEMIGLPVSFEGQRPPMRRPPPKAGEHTAEIVGRPRP